LQDNIPIIPIVPITFYQTFQSFPMTNYKTVQIQMESTLQYTFLCYLWFVGTHIPRQPEQIERMQ
jgi:hypothetical protein